MKTLQERLIFARELAGKSQLEVANFIGVKQPSISDLEIGHTQKSKYTAEIAHFLGVDAYWLATGIGEIKPEIPNTTMEKLLKLKPHQKKAVTDLIDSMSDDSTR